MASKLAFAQVIQKIVDLNYVDRSSFDTDVAALEADAVGRPLMRFMWILGAGRSDRYWLTHHSSARGVSYLELSPCDGSN
jgi:hypothetical protein